MCLLESFREFVCPELPEGFTFTFHAGFMDETENSISSVKKAVELNAPVIELDVTFRDDGTPVIVHSSSAGKDGGESLDEAFGIVASHPAAKLNLDIKSVANIPAVDALIKKHGLENRAFYTGIDAGWVETMKRDTDIPYWLNHNVNEFEALSSDFPRKIAAKIKDCGAVGLNTNYLFINRRIVDYLHEEGIPVSLWTPNNEIAIKHVLNLRPDNITTRRPDILKSLLKQS